MNEHNAPADSTPTSDTAPTTPRTVLVFSTAKVHYLHPTSTEVTTLCSYRPNQGEYSIRHQNNAALKVTCKRCLKLHEMNTSK